MEQYLDNAVTHVEQALSALRAARQENSRALNTSKARQHARMAVRYLDLQMQILADADEVK